MADPQTELQPNKAIYLGVLVIGLVLLGVLFYRYGFLVLPNGSAQQIAAYYGTRFLPLGVALTLIGFVVGIATAVGTAFGKVAKSGATPETLGLGVSDITDLLKAASSLSATPAGIGILLTVVGVALLVGSGFASTATPPAATS